MDMDNINNCVSLDVHPLTSSSVAVKSHHNPRKKRTKFLSIDTSHAALTSKPKPTTRRDPTTPKITRPCTECGKKFWSWKALFGHMRCHPERQWRGINPPPNFRQPPETTSSEPAEDSSAVTEEDHEVATCLLMLANGPAVAAPDQEQSPSACTVNQGMLENSESGRDAEPNVVDGVGLSCRFECSSCKKVFGSHQALGGHRASHKNVKGCYANTKNDGEEEEEGCCIIGGGEGEVMKENNEKIFMSLGHKCSICLRDFSSGQALGGHKRCHWEKIDEEASASGLSPRASGLDLNSPAPLVEDDDSSSYSAYSSLLNLDLSQFINLFAVAETIQNGRLRGISKRIFSNCKEIFIDDVCATPNDWVLEDKGKESFLEVPLLVFYIHAASVFWFVICLHFGCSRIYGMEE
ncbi:hypothetical protein Pfo_003010 [Paulownia fortunei]|nr:hypothetical protein Pfo_003010 [Paulownia fortunei]